MTTLKNMPAMLMCILVLMLMSCDRQSDIKQEEFVLLMKNRVVKDLSVVNREFVQFRLDAEILQQSGLNAFYNGKAMYRMDIESHMTFIKLFHELQQDLPSNERISYGIESRHGMPLYTWLSIILQFAFPATVIVLLVLILRKLSTLQRS